MEELVYTSAPQGLQPGSTGFCTVEMTEGMPPATREALESLSAYDNDPSGTVNWLHVRMPAAQGMQHVLSRIGPLKGEFSGRTNKLAHHLCLPSSELTPHGPMQFLGTGGPLRHQWSGHVRRLPRQSGATKLRAASPTRVCRSWASVAGDAGLAGAVLSRLLRSSSSTLWLVRPPQIDALAMTDEMLALLRPQDRWGITCCTYLHSLPRSVECRLRWVLPGSPAMQRLGQLGPDQLIDLRGGCEDLVRDADASMVDAARHGKMIAGGIRSRHPARVSTPATAAERPAAARQSLDQTLPEPSKPAPQVPLPAPPPQTGSTARWVMIGVAIALIPACAVIFFLITSDPAPVAAMRQLEHEQRAESQPMATTPIQPVDKPEAKPPARSEPPVKRAKRDKKPPAAVVENKPPPKASKPKKTKPAIQQTTRVSLRLPTRALSARPTMQPIHQAAGVRVTALHQVAPMLDTTRFQLSEPDDAGVRDLNYAAAADGQRGRIGSLYTEPDRVLLAWSPTARRDLASSFLLAHELVIRDQTHETTVQFDLAEPIEVPTLRVPRQSTDIPIPQWILPEFECRVKPTFFSSISDQGISFNLFAVTPHSQHAEPEVYRRKQGISALQDPKVKHVEILLAGKIIGTGTARKIRLSSGLELGGSGKPFSWNIRENAIRDQVAKHNKNAADKDKMNASERLKKIDQWGSSLRCEIELYARINDRDVLWGKSGGQAE